VVAYNLGETETRRLLRENLPLPKSYLRRVMTAYQDLKEKYEG